MTGKRGHMRLNEKDYTRVTAILSRYSDFSAIDPDTLARAADRGTRVHNYCEMYANNIFIPSVDDDCKNYFEAYQRWFDSHVEHVLLVEKRIYNDDYRITGQIDLIAKIKGDDDYSIIDIKTPATSSKTWALQTAAYKMMAKEHLKDKSDIWIDRRACLMLPKTGKDAFFLEYDDIEDEDLFLHALKLYRFFNK